MLVHYLLVCLLRRFCCSRLVLLRVSVLFLHAFLAVFVISFNLAFLSFTCFLLLTFPAVAYFFSLCFFISVFTSILLHKRIWALYGPDNVDWIKRVLGPICLCLPEPFCQGTVLCGRSVFYCRSVFCCRFAFCCRLLSLALISLDLSCSSVFLVGLWALLFIGFSSVWAFGHGFKKWASTIYQLRHKSELI